MRIATLQFAPRLGDVQGNIERANALLKNGKTISLDGKKLGAGIGIELLRPDILVLPELALTGYNFPSLEEIRPYLEPAGEGPSASWARETARRLQCKVCVGYPEIEKTSETNETACYNSLLMLDENGELILNYRKSFLYFTDETWAAEGNVERGFHALSFGSKQVATSFGICMDINPYKFEAPWTKWEFAHRVLDSKSQLVVLSMAWLTTLSREELDALNGEPEMDTFNYWIQRFWPLLKKRMQHEDVDLDGNKQTILVFANRAGEEPPVEEGKPPARYAGTSAIIAITQRPVPGTGGEPGPRPGPGSREEKKASETNDAAEPPLDAKILCWDMLGAAEEGICFADTTADPQMVFGLRKASV
ncbi:Carbon-nitrogen hydrolase [Penicillium lagena]|uniref:Carbon-nitrogen hydrolase n=1 Tax=Penicillium lagena TaxID=94218 RepID=UPI002541E51B|nr:Carbon-nitrogen hydrolase [Penicillium lagena]KAJ5619226.1 Carbon-nitrogen hydrolase [Penicillium lagena]